jgi:hypothetical protein
MINDVDFDVFCYDSETISVEVRTELDNGEWSVKADLSEKSARKLIRDLESALRVLKASRGEAEDNLSHDFGAKEAV